MKGRDQKTVSKCRPPTVALVARAMDAAVHDAVELHKQSGLPLAVWQDGKVVLVPADQVKIRRNGTKPRRRKA